MNQPYRTLFGALVVATAAGCTDTKPEAQGPRPHILLVTADSLRADHLSFNGYPRNTSPEIDAFAGSAWNFSQAVTVIPKTDPSFATLFTGRHPREHGVRSNANAIPPSLSTLAERLQDSGYRTAAFVNNPVLREEKGYTRGFDTYSLLDEKSGPAAVSHAFLLWGRELEGWQQPTFVWLHYIDPHGPYDPPPGPARSVSRRPKTSGARVSSRSDSGGAATMSIPASSSAPFRTISASKKNLASPPTWLATTPRSSASTAPSGWS